VLADTQDNPGAGGASDTVGLLEALVRNDAKDAVFGMLYDPAAATAAHNAGTGSEIELSIGAGSGQPGHLPFQGRFTIEALTNGEFIGTGPMKRGVRYRMGPTALLRIGGVRVVVTSGKTQVNDQALLRHIGLDLEQQRILAIKSSVHFRADFTGLAGDILVVVAPGPNVADHLALDYQRLRSGVRLVPLGAERRA
jgi:microcystin degradation protein MlrC